jgi:acylphosphatase
MTIDRLSPILALNFSAYMVYKRIIIRGRVQGVYFRASAKEKASALGLTGEVRNLEDESVEVLVAGDEQRVEQLIAWCRIGPPSARVEEVVVSDIEPKEFDGFRVVRRWG